MFDYSIRTVDLDLFKFVLLKITKVIHYESSRLFKIFDSLPQLLKPYRNNTSRLVENYKQCFLCIRRTAKPFSRVPIDLTLEQNLIKESTNPSSLYFSRNILYNISSWQTVSNDIYDFCQMSNLKEKSSESSLHRKIVTKLTDLTRQFWKTKIISFESRLIKLVKLNGKVKEMKVQRDVFSWLLYASPENNISMEKALTYPLAPVSISLCHGNGEFVVIKELSV